MCISKQQVSSQKNKEVVFTKQIIQTISTRLRLKRCPMSRADPNAAFRETMSRVLNLLQRYRKEEMKDRLEFL